MEQEGPLKYDNLGVNYILGLKSPRFSWIRAFQQWRRTKLINVVGMTGKKTLKEYKSIIKKQIMSKEVNTQIEDLYA